jgi:hypothetical protein
MPNQLSHNHGFTLVYDVRLATGNFSSQLGANTAWLILQDRRLVGLLYILIG